MEIKIFTDMIRDKHFCNYEKMKYKYSDNFDCFLSELSLLYYKELPLKDFDNNPIVYSDGIFSVPQNTVKMLMQSRSQSYGSKAAEEEIIASSAIESIGFSRDSVRSILRGYAPKDEIENRIFGQKKGLEFISDKKNTINEENFYKLYMMTAGDFLDDNNRLKNGHKYRHDEVFIVSDKIEHSGISWKKIPSCMKSLMDFINMEDDINDLVKAAIIHFYISYIHPYFDGNGSIARLVHLWFLYQRGYQSALFIPFSSRIEKSRKEYYNAYTLVEKNKKYSGCIDVAPLVAYFIENVYKKINASSSETDVLSDYNDALKNGLITSKESQLWKFVVSQYGTEEFSTKQLEKDFGNAAYATIREFVLKFTELELLDCRKYGQRNKYRIR